MKIRFKNRCLLWLVYGFLFFFNTSCSEAFHYTTYQKIKGSWDKEQEYYFTYQIEDHSVAYDFYLEVRNNEFYPYQNIWFFYSEKDSAQLFVRDTIECMLADNFGKWYGTGVSIYHLSIPIRKQYKYSHTGEYTFSIRQGMREDQLKGIEEIGLRIEKSKNN